MRPESNQIVERKPLKLRIGHSGDHHCEQAWRNNTHAVYKHFGAHGQFIGWEAIKITVRKAETVYGKQYPERESYPSAEDFGKTAVSVGAQYSLEDAIERAKKL